MMSGKGNCYDNAQAESFWARLKTELLEGGAFRSVEEARIDTFSYIDGYYNRIRRHSALGLPKPGRVRKVFKELLFLSHKVNIRQAVRYIYNA